MAEPQYPEYILALHSSKRLLIEQLNSSQHLLADAIINLTLAKGQRHEGRFHIKISNKKLSGKLSGQARVEYFAADNGRNNSRR